MLWLHLLLVKKPQPATRPCCARRLRTLILKPASITRDWLKTLRAGRIFPWQLCWIIGRGAFHKFSNVVSPTTYGGTALTFDPEDRLSAFGTAQTDRYDGDGHRAAKNIGSTYYYLYDGDRVLATGQPTGALGGLNTWGADGLVSTRSATYSVYDTFDERGGLAQRLSAAGGVYTTDKYDAFGSRTSTAIPSDGWGFGAQWGYFTDKETGLVLCGHRFYDPGTGRWLTQGPCWVQRRRQPLRLLPERLGEQGGCHRYGLVPAPAQPFPRQAAARWPDHDGSHSRLAKPRATAVQPRDAAVQRAAGSPYTLSDGPRVPACHGELSTRWSDQCQHTSRIRFRRHVDSNARRANQFRLWLCGRKRGDKSGILYARAEWQLSVQWVWGVNRFDGYVRPTEWQHRLYRRRIRTRSTDLYRRRNNRLVAPAIGAITSSGGEIL